RKAHEDLLRGDARKLRVYVVRTPKEIKSCVICGTDFEGRTSQQLCGKQECKTKRASQRVLKCLRKKRAALGTATKEIKNCVICRAQFEGCSRRVTCGKPECQKRHQRNHIALLFGCVKQSKMCVICGVMFEGGIFRKTCGKPECTQANRYRLSPGRGRR